MTPTMPPVLDPNYPRWVEDPSATMACRECAQRTTIQITPNGRVVVGLPPDPLCPFCEGTGQMKRKIMAQSPAHHAGIVGYPVGPDGERLRPKPPTLEEVMKTGRFDEVTAVKIVAQEAEKAAKGFKPYGDNEPEALKTANVEIPAIKPTPEVKPDSTSGADDPLAGAEF